MKFLEKSHKILTFTTHCIDTFDVLYLNLISMSLLFLLFLHKKTNFKVYFFFYSIYYG